MAVSLQMGGPWLGRQPLPQETGKITHAISMLTCTHSKEARLAQDHFSSWPQCPRVVQMECCYATAYAPYARTEVLPIEWSRFQYLLCNPIVQQWYYYTCVTPPSQQTGTCRREFTARSRSERDYLQHPLSTIAYMCPLELQHLVVAPGML